MSEWTTIELGQLADFRNGLNYSAGDNGVGLSIVGVSDFQDKSFVDFSSLAELDPSALSTPDALIRKDDILFVRSNGNRELIGRSLLVLDNPPKPTSHSGFTIRLRFTDNRADPRFFAYLLRGGTIRRRLSSQGGGTSINNLNQGILSRLAVPLPPLETQRRIASILGAYDDLIEVNRRRIAVLEEMARGLFEEWFVRFRFPGHEAVPILDTQHGPLPEGWGYGPFTEVADVLSGGTPKKDKAEYWGGDIPFFTPRDAPGTAWIFDTLANVTVKGVANCNSKLYPENTVFITARGTVGKVALAAVPMAMNQSCYALVGKGYPQHFLFGFTQWASARLQAMSNGAVFDTIIVDTFRKLQLPIPPVALAWAYEEKATPILEMSRVVSASIKRLVASRDLLLPRLISGQLSVAEAERHLEKVA